MKDAVVVSAVRTAVGRAPKGTLNVMRPDDMAAVAIEQALARVPGLDKNDVDDVIVGCAMPEGEQGWTRVDALNRAHGPAPRVPRGAGLYAPAHGSPVAAEEPRDQCRQARRSRTSAYAREA